MHAAYKDKFVFGPTPWGSGEESKGQISFNFNYKVNFKEFFLNQTLCVFSQIYQTDFLLCPLGHALGWDLGSFGVKNKIPSVRPLCYLLLNHWTKSNQI